MTETTLQRIARKTGKKPTECGCTMCQQQCQTPCVGTPEDMFKIIEAGYSDRLIMKPWIAGAILLPKDHKPVLMLQSKMNPETKHCTFFQACKCELHDLGLKPTEGKLSHHSLSKTNFNPKKAISLFVAKEWINTTMTEMDRLINKYIKPIQPIKSEKEADEVKNYLIQETINQLGIAIEEATIRVNALFNSGILNDIDPRSDSGQLQIDVFLQIPSANSAHLTTKDNHEKI